MQERNLSVGRTAKFCQLGEITEQTEQLWFVCHGYGQLAKYFIPNFKCLQDEKTVVVAPEALSRFYLNGFSGNVGASWMTSEDRFSEINDYVAYLDDLHKEITSGHDVSSINLTVLGFSQGVATACRWVLAGEVKASRLILWAGAPPSEMDSKEAFESISNLKLSFVYGTEDKLIKASKLKEVKDQLEKNGIRLDVRTFKGGHKLDEGILLELKN